MSYEDYEKRKIAEVKFNITYKSKIQVGNFTIYNEKHFNKLQKIMWKLLLGIKIENVNVKM